jgi:hypothetical protein
VAAQTAPPYFLSNYVTSLNYSNWDSYGCQQVHYSTGEGVSQISLILDFGTPWDTGGEYGTVLPQSGIFAQWDSGGQSGIRFLIANFLLGYWNCHTSKSPSIILVIGDANVYTYSNNTNAYWMGQVVDAVDGWLQSNGWSGLEYAVAGSDTETEWASYSPTVAYLQTVYDNEGAAWIYDFGDAGGCSTSSYSSGGSCNNGWTQSQVLSISWGEPWADPLPEIYNQLDAQAEQWYEISLGSLAAGEGPLAFDAELTQYTACEQVGGCTGVDNTPAVGWAELYDIMYNNANTRPGVVNVLNSSDDIRYLG